MRRHAANVQAPWQLSFGEMLSSGVAELKPYRVGLQGAARDTKQGI